MKTPKLAALATTALISAGGLWAAGAFAQQPQTQPPLQQPPSVSQPQPPSTTTTPSADNAAMQRTGAQMQADMATRFLARAKSALQLTAEQEKQWPAVEQAIRDGVRRRADLMERFRAQGEASDPVQRMRRMSELFAARSESFSKIADAVQPLYASLSDDQKQRLRRVMPGADGRMAMHDGGRRQDERRGDRFERFHEEMMRHWRGNGGGMFGMPGMGGRDDRDHDPLFASAAVTHAADIAVLSAVMGHLDEHTQQQNGTASIHLNFLRPLSGVLTVEGRIASWGSHDAIVEVDGRDERGHLVLKGLSTYSLRPREPRGDA